MKELREAIREEIVKLLPIHYEEAEGIKLGDGKAPLGKGHTAVMRDPMESVDDTVERLVEIFVERFRK